MPVFQHAVSEALSLALVISFPVLAVSLVVGLVISLFQAVTQIQDQALSFVPKLLATSLALLVVGGWMAAEVVRFTESLWRHSLAH